MAIIIIISLFKVGFTITFHNYKPIGSSYTNQSANLLVFEINSFLKFSWVNFRSQDRLAIFVVQDENVS